MSLYFEQQTDIVGRRVPRIVSGGDDGNQATFSAPLAAPPWQVGDFVTRRIPRLSSLTGDDGIEAQFDSSPTTLSKWQFAAQDFQPPAQRVYQRYAAALRADAADQDDLGPLFVPVPSGWVVQGFQPSVPWRTGRFAFGAVIAQGDGGTAAIFVPPWTFASPAKNFPDYQNLAPGALPTWNAGAPPGAIKSQPNINLPIALKSAPGNLLVINVVVAGTTPGGVYDVAGIFPTTLNQIAVIPNTVDGKPLVYDWPCQNGILIVPGLGQVVSAKWD